MSPIPIRRFLQTTDQTAPWEGVEFTFDVDSDELGEALKARYPQYRTLPLRKYAAIIEFLNCELSELASGNARQRSSKNPQMHDSPCVGTVSLDARVNVQSFVHAQNTSSPVHSPAPSNCSSAPHETRGDLTATMTPSPQPSYVDPTAAAQSGHFVFSAVDGRAQQEKKRRTMTAEEKLGYNETRKRGACSNCKRLKERVRTREAQRNPPALTVRSVHTLMALGKPPVLMTLSQISLRGRCSSHCDERC